MQWSVIRMSVFLLSLCCGAVHAQAQVLSSPTDTQLRVYFMTDQSKLSAESKQQVKQIIPALKQIQDTIWLYGHCDDRGTEQYNQWLSEQRTATIRQFLVDAGIAPARIKQIGFGELNPIADNQQIAGRALNRRVEINIRSIMPNDQLQEIDSGLVWVGTVSTDMGPEPLEMVIQTNDTSWLFMSDSIGRYALSLPAAKQYCVFAFKDGYRTASKCLDGQQLLAEQKNDTLFWSVVLTKAQVKDKLVIPDIYFETNLPVFLTSSYKGLKRLSDALKADSSLIVEIQGHVNYPVYRKSTPETDRFFAWLSFERAHAVYLYCVKTGVAPQRMTYRGLSNKFMVYPYAMSEREKRMNRRVEVLVLE